MFIDAALELAQVGFPIRTYTYVGMSSIFYTDVILFHKYLGLNNIIAVERRDELKPRMNFNRPFGCVKVKIQQMSDIVVGLDRDVRYLLWLDYDEPLVAAATEDVRLACNILRSGSLLLLTVPIFPGRTRKKEDMFAYYRESTGDYFDAGWSDEDFSPNRVVKSLTKIIMMVIKAGVQGRYRIHFQPLFYFRYADGREMLTIGGMICDQYDRRKIQTCDFGAHSYVRKSLSIAPFQIRNPILTRKERAHADACMPARAKFLVTTLGFSKEELVNYRQTYRFLPSYSELLLG